MTASLTGSRLSQLNNIKQHNTTTQQSRTMPRVKNSSLLTFLINEEKNNSGIENGGE